MNTQKNMKTLLSISSLAINNFTISNYKLPLLISNIYIRKIFALIQLDKFKEAIEFGIM
jgi:hypothetical protein